jgi:vesicle coat complex subunit
MSTYMKEQGKCGEDTERHEKLTSNDKQHNKHDSVKRDIRDMTPGEDVSSLHCRLS